MEAELLVEADAGRQVDERRRHALMQLKWERVEMIDLTVGDNGKEPALDQHGRPIRY